MSNNNKTRKKTRHKTNNSQSAGMTSGMSNTPIVVSSVVQGTPQIGILPEVDNDDIRQASKTVLGTSSSGQVVEPLQNPEEEEEEELRSDHGSGMVEFEELTELGSPY